MSDSSLETRRNLLGLAAAGAALGAVSGLSPKAQAGEPAFFSSWVHGHSVAVERPIPTPSKNSVASAFVARGPFSDTSNTYYDGDTLLVHGSGASSACAVAVSRVATGARFVVYDRGTQDQPQSGRFSCHYAVPTPVQFPVLIPGQVQSQRASLFAAWVTFNAPTSQIKIISMHVWDGENHVFGQDNLNVAPPFIRLVSPIHHDVAWGMGISLQLEAINARNTFLEIRSAGIDFQFFSP